MKPSPRLAAILEALLVSIIWASSFVVVKLGLDDLGPLTIAAFRYFGAFLILLPFLARRLPDIWRITPRLWLSLLVAGLSSYTIGNGAMFMALKYLPATTVSFMMSVTPLLVLFSGVIWLREMPTRWQVVGVFTSLTGSVLFFFRGLAGGELRGLVFALLGTLAFTVFALVGRAMARDRMHTLILTAIPLGLGGGALLAVALPFEGLPVMTPRAWMVVIWLALINTALGYVLYNHALRILQALEMNIMLNLTPLGTALLAWMFLGERLSPLQWAGMLIVILGVFLVQQRTR